ncbi:MAG: hypothetical protein R3B69_03575 [Candidatus Paceibacterota bacterium]
MEGLSMKNLWLHCTPPPFLRATDWLSVPSEEVDGAEKHREHDIVVLDICSEMKMTFAQPPAMGPLLLTAFVRR